MSGLIACPRKADSYVSKILEVTLADAANSRWCVRGLNRVLTVLRRGRTALRFTGRVTVTGVLTGVVVFFVAGIFF